MLGDHYDPIHKRLVLSRDNFHGTSTAALPVPSFEVDQLLSVVSPLRLTSFYLSMVIEPRLAVSD